MDKYQLVEYLKNKFNKHLSKNIRIKETKTMNEVGMYIEHPHMYTCIISEIKSEINKWGWYIWYYRAYTYDKIKKWGMYNSIHTTEMIRNKQIKDINLIFKPYDQNRNN